MGLKGKRIIIRIDDIGYTDVCNMGAFQTLERGIATAADVMLDCPGTEDALRRLRDFPWISIGWHTHFWGKPVLPADKVPTLIDPETGRFKEGLENLEDVSYAEMYAELEAQVSRCIDILGKSPDTGYSPLPGTKAPFQLAMAAINDKYLIAYNYQQSLAKNTMPPMPESMLKEMMEKFKDDPDFQGGMPGPSPMPERVVDERWKNAYVSMDGNFTKSLSCNADSIREFVATYNPVRAFLDDEIGLADMDPRYVMGYAFHPGYIDEHMYYDGDPFDAKYNFLLPRIVDIHALCSDTLKKWVADNGIVLCSFTDALYGQDRYQRHLKDIGSDMCMI